MRVRHAHEGFEALLDVRHDHQMVDDRIRRLGGDDAGLGDADVAVGAAALLGVADGGALHRPLHRPRAAAGADVEAAQAELVADLLGVLVFVALDRMATPAHDQVRVEMRAQDAGIAQDLEYGVGDAVRLLQVEAAGLDVAGDVGDVAHDREQQLADAADDLALDEGITRRIQQFKLDAAILLVHLDVEIGVAIKQRARIVGSGTAGEHGQRAAAHQLVQSAVAGIAQTPDFLARQHVHSAHRRNAGIQGNWGHLGVVPLIRARLRRMPGQSDSVINSAGTPPATRSASKPRSHNKYVAEALRRPESQ